MSGGKPSTEGRLWGWASRLQVLYLGSLGLVSALLVAGEKIEAVWQSPTLLYLYLVMDLFKVEIFLLLLLLLFGPWLLRAVGQAWSVTLTVLQQGGWRNPRVVGWLAVMVAFLLLVGAAGFHQARYYVLGKKIRIDLYPRTLYTRSVQALDEGRTSAGRLGLRVCTRLTDDFRCRQALEQLAEREALSARLRRFVEELPPENEVRLLLLEDLYWVSKDEQLYREVVGRYESDLQRLREVYRAALEKLEQGDDEKAAAGLAVVQRDFPGLGDCHVLLEEIRRRETRSSHPTPYLDALQRFGAAEFERRVWKPRQPVSVEDLESRTTDESGLTFFAD